VIRINPLLLMSLNCRDVWHMVIHMKRLLLTQEMPLPFGLKQQKNLVIQFLNPEAIALLLHEKCKTNDFTKSAHSSQFVSLVVPKKRLVSVEQKSKQRLTQPSGESLFRRFGFAAEKRGEPGLSAIQPLEPLGQRSLTSQKSTILCDFEWFPPDFSDKMAF